MLMVMLMIQVMHSGVHMPQGGTRVPSTPFPDAREMGLSPLGDVTIHHLGKVRSALELGLHRIAVFKLCFH